MCPLYFVFILLNKNQWGNFVLNNFLTEILAGREPKVFQYEKNLVYTQKVNCCGMCLFNKKCFNLPSSSKSIKYISLLIKYYAVP